MDRLDEVIRSRGEDGEARRAADHRVALIEAAEHDEGAVPAGARRARDLEEGEWTEDIGNCVNRAREAASGSESPRERAFA